MIDSSPSSTESSFRELDEVFLQTQTRIWLGEVLNIRLDEALHLSSLLQDGEILFKVSKVVWKLLLTKCIELRHLKHKYKPFGSRRSIGRYKPYSNVDSFIKICKIMGLSGIDLFSPSDVVEKRDTRKVCICIRALSKKARSKQLSVPDFDMVICSLAMSKNMVGVIRKSLESSQCTLSSSSSYSSPKISPIKLKQKKLFARFEGDDDYSNSEGSDEAESRYMGENSFSCTGTSDYADGLDSDLEKSPEGQCIDEFKKHERFKSASLSKNVQPYSQQHLDNDYSVVGDSSYVNADGESNYISSYLAFSDLMVHATDISNSDIRDGENNMFDFFLNVDSEGVTSNSKIFNNGDDDDIEVSSTASMSSVLGRLLNLEFDDQFDDENSLVLSEALRKVDRGNAAVLFDSREVQSETTDRCELSSVVEPSEGDLRDMRTGNAENHFFCDNHETLLPREDEDNVASHYSTCKSFDESERSSEHHYNIDVPSSSVQETPPVVPDDTTIHTSVGRSNLCEINSERHPCTASRAENDSREESVSAGRKDGRRRVLTTVVKGTVIAGVLFLLLLIRKSKGNEAEEAKRYGQVLKHSGSKSPFTKRQKGCVGKGIYPADTIKL